MDLLKLEQQRQSLEQNLQKLRASLKTWQTWEAEYEGLKEEMQTIEPEGITGLTDMSKAFDGELVTEKEIRDIVGLDRSTPRTAPEISGLISRRQEYVQKNIDTIQRQYWDAEAKLEEIDFATFSAQRTNDSLPLTEIHEELDDDDNVVSSRLSQPEAQTAGLVTALRKVGLTDADIASIGTGAQEDEASESTTVDDKHNAGSISPGADTLHEEGSLPERPMTRKKTVSFSADTKVPPRPVRSESDDGKKSVSFAEKVAIAPAAAMPDNRSVSFASDVQEIPAEPQVEPATGQRSKADIQRDLRQLFKPGDKVGELNDNDELAMTHIVLPENESEEDAQTRREMLQYHLHEVGNVVAQLDLDEDYDDADDAISASDPTTSEPYDEDTPYTSAMEDTDVESEEEDEYGRSTKSMISDEYRKEMQELERRLIANLGAAPSAQDLHTIDPEIDPKDVRRLVIREKRSSVSSISSDGEKKPNLKKRVSFAEALDVAEVEEPPTKAVKKEDDENVAPVSETVLERSRPAQPSQEFPTKVIADSLQQSLPKEIVSNPSSDDQLDTIMQRRELATEYYKRRNDIIRQQGGFTANIDDRNEDEDHGELMEERDGKLKKVSRFRAARIRS